MPVGRGTVYYMSDNCAGAEFNVPPIYGYQSWDGQGVSGTIMYSGVLRSRRLTNGTCDDSCYSTGSDMYARIYRMGGTATTYSASISGSQELNNGDVGSWQATSNLPGAPIGCAWMVDGSSVSTGGACDLSRVFNDGPQSHTIDVALTDANGRTASATGFLVAVHSCAGCGDYRKVRRGAPTILPPPGKGHRE